MTNPVQDAAIYKSFTIDAEEVLRNRAQSATAIPTLDNFIAKMIKDPLQNIETDVMAKLKDLENSLTPELKEFYNSHICVSVEECLAIFQSTLDQAESEDWYKHRKYRVTASTARKINNARNAQTRYGYFTR